MLFALCYQFRDSCFGMCHICLLVYMCVVMVTKTLQICAPAASLNKIPVTLLSSQSVGGMATSTPAASPCGLKPVAAANSPSQPEVCSGDADAGTGPEEEDLLTASGVEQAPPTPTPPTTPATPTPPPQTPNPPTSQMSSKVSAIITPSSTINSSSPTNQISSSSVILPSSVLSTSSAPFTMVPTITSTISLTSVPIPVVTATVVTTPAPAPAPALSHAPAPKPTTSLVNPPPVIPPPHHHHTIHHSPSADAAQAVPTIVRRTPTIENVNLKFLPIQTLTQQSGSTHTVHQYFPVQHIISSSSLARASNAVVVAAPSVGDAGPRATIQTASILGILTTNTAPVPAVDQQIRVLTPSEIMRTLPSLEPPSSLASVSLVAIIQSISCYLDLDAFVCVSYQFR